MSINKPYEFNNLYRPLYESHHFIVDFCNFEIDEFDDVNMVFWINNMTDKIVDVKTSDVFVNGNPDSDLEGDEICSIFPNTSGYYKLLLWSLSPEGKYRIRLYIELTDNLNNILGRSHHLFAEVNFDRKKQVASTIKQENEWFDWDVSEQLYDYIKEITNNNSLVWIPTKLLSEHGVRVFNEVCGDCMSGKDIITEAAYIGTVYIQDFVDWLHTKGINLNDKKTNTYYEIVHWNLRSAIGSKYEITQIYSKGNNDSLNSFTLFYSFNKNDLSKSVQKNAYFYQCTFKVPNNEENISKKIHYSINKKNATVFLKNYKKNYGLRASEEKLDERIKKWEDIRTRLVLEEKKILARIF